jgi:glycerol-3-phosphate dehydrogenase
MGRAPGVFNEGPESVGNLLLRAPSVGQRGRPGMQSRRDAIRTIENGSFDVCVIGGGATGAGCALDSQLRGLHTVLLEGADFASATSSASTKIVHGGVRYLQEAFTEPDIHKLRLVKRALRERVLMLRNAPFLTRRLDFLVPCRSWLDLLYYGLGMKIYDGIAGRAVLFPSRYVSPNESRKRIPRLKSDRLRGTVAYSDGQFDDCRYGISLVGTFTGGGGEALNYARVVGFEREPSGKLAAAVVEDQVGQERFVVRARAFVNATGPFADNVRDLATPGIQKRIRLSKGVHIVLPLNGFSNGDALLIPKTEDGRVIFAVPWLGRLLVGTTEDEATLQEELVVKRSEVEYLLRHLNQFLVEPFSLDQVMSGMAGLRPLVSSSDLREPKKLVRDDEVELDPASGLISILGGKWTTYRAMAQDTINAVQRYLGGPVTECRTRQYPLAGSEGYAPDYGETLATQYRISPEAARHLSQKFGTRSPSVLELTKENPELAFPILEGLAPIRAEVVYCVRHEMAISIEDILARRIGLQMLSWRDAIRAAPVVGALLAQDLGWSAAQMQEAVGQYVSKINRFLGAAGLAAD